jgi:hypothetical protein
MRLSPNLKFQVALATIAPLGGIFFSGAFMAAVALGLWDPWAGYIPVRTAESIGWSGLVVLGAVFAALHFILVVFYISHIITNHAVPGLARILFVVGTFLVPVVVMAVYFFIYILPEEPRPWALKASRLERDPA